jgi:hypothetical protein
MMASRGCATRKAAASPSPSAATGRARSSVAAAISTPAASAGATAFAEEDEGADMEDLLRVWRASEGETIEKERALLLGAERVPRAAWPGAWVCACAGVQLCSAEGAAVSGLLVREVQVSSGQHSRSFSRPPSAAAVRTNARTSSRASHFTSTSQPGTPRRCRAKIALAVCAAWRALCLARMWCRLRPTCSKPASIFQSLYAMVCARVGNAACCRWPPRDAAPREEAVPPPPSNRVTCFVCCNY